MKKGLACLGLMLALAMPALAWRPAGWVYFSWPYSYDHGSGDWYYFSPNNVQWSVRHGSAEGWLRLNNSALAQGWSWHAWPYAYCHANASWYNFAAAKNHRCVNLTTERWGIFGVPPAPRTGMVTIPGGTNAGTDPDFGAYSLTVNPFHIDKYEMSKAMWDVVRNWGSTRGYTDLPTGTGKAANHPVVGVNWYDCVKWCNANSQQEGWDPVYYTDAAYTQVYKVGEVDGVFAKASANGRRLPTAVEWEYAARGGVAGQRFPWSPSNTIQHNRANYDSSDTYAYDTSATRGLHPTYAEGAEPHTAPIDVFAGNEFGLYNMAGNAWEWCANWHPLFPDTDRVLRGGGWDSTAGGCRVGSNVNYEPATRYKSVGFRTVIHP